MRSFLKSLSVAALLAMITGTAARSCDRPLVVAGGSSALVVGQSVFAPPAVAIAQRQFVGRRQVFVQRPLIAQRPLFVQRPLVVARPLIALRQIIAPRRVIVAPSVIVRPGFFGRGAVVNPLIVVH